ASPPFLPMLPQATYVLISSALLCTLIARLPAVSVLMSADTSLVDLPSTTFDRGYLGFGSGVGHEPSWMCAGCDTPLGAPFRVISTLVLSPAGVSLAVPLSPDLFCCDSFTVTLFASDFFFADFSLSCANASPPIASPHVSTTVRGNLISKGLHDMNVNCVVRETRQLETGWRDAL